jgi:hypothetical protein
MTEAESRAEEANWSCNNCGAPQAIPPGSRYHRCSTCGALYKLRWRSGRLDMGAIRSLPVDAVDSRLEPELLRESIRRQRERLRELTDSIRRLEMSKGSERISLAAVFVLICAAVYILFAATVEGVEKLTNPGVIELAIGGISAVSLLVLIILRLRRGAIVRKAQMLHQEHDEVEASLESGEAILALRGLEPAEEAEAETEEPSEGRDDIIGKFAMRQKERRSRLGLRDSDEGGEPSD